MSPCTSPHSFSSRLSLLVAFAALSVLAIPARAQVSPEPQNFAAAALPDSPGNSLLSENSSVVSSSASGLAAAEATLPEAAAGFGQRLGSHVPDMASHTDKYIEPGQKVPALSASDKVKLGLRDAVSPFAIMGWVSSAAYSQALDSSPNYGQGWGPFGQRVGAAAARGSTEGILSDSVFAPLFHEDPRYYRLGSGHSLFNRAIYAVTRTVVTRSDSGKSTPNLALLTGNAAGSILTNAYYPQRNRDVKDTVETFGGSIGGSAVGFFVSEFLSDTLSIVHLKSNE